jgi:hypothetical protein
MSSFVVHETWKCCSVGNCLHHNWLDAAVGLGMQFISAHNLRDTGAVASVRAAEIYGLEILMDGIQVHFSLWIHAHYYWSGNLKSHKYGF